MTLVSLRPGNYRLDMTGQRGSVDLRVLSFVHGKCHIPVLKHDFGCLKSSGVHGGEGRGCSSIP